MTTEQLRNMQFATPFRAFRIHVADGRSLDVPHPEMLSYQPGGRTVIVHLPEDLWEVLDLLLINGLEVTDGKPRGARRRNGR